MAGQDSSDSPSRTLGSSLSLGNENGSSAFSLPPPAPPPPPPPSDMSQLQTSFASHLNPNAPVFVPFATSSSISNTTNETDLPIGNVFIPLNNSPFHLPIPSSEAPMIVPAACLLQDNDSYLQDFHDALAFKSEINVHQILDLVEYYFSDINLATTMRLWGYITKDPEGYVPIWALASFPKLKDLITSESHLSSVLCRSEKLVVSEDGKKVGRRYPLTVHNMNILASRIVYVSNFHRHGELFPSNNLHKSLMKFFSSAGGIVKNIRICYPSDNIEMSYAYAEYESVEMAEKAVAELKDIGDTGKGLEVCVLTRLRSKFLHKRAKKKPPKEKNDRGAFERKTAHTADQCSKKDDRRNASNHVQERVKNTGQETDNSQNAQPVLQKKAEKADGNKHTTKENTKMALDYEDTYATKPFLQAVLEKKAKQKDEVCCEEDVDASNKFEHPKTNWKLSDGQTSPEDAREEHVISKVWNKNWWYKRGGAARSRGHGKAKFCHFSNNHSSHVKIPPSNNLVDAIQATVANSQPAGPRMPDGTRGFTMGRGKLLAARDS